MSINVHIPKNVKMDMDIYGHLWTFTFTDINRYHNEKLSVHKCPYPGKCKNGHGHLWTFMDIYGHLWTLKKTKKPSLV